MPLFSLWRRCNFDMATYLFTVYAPRCLDKLTLLQEGRRMENIQKGSGQAVLRKRNAQVCKLLKDIPDLQMTLFLNYL